ncbi:hypothetical protein BR93DRAFT_928371 [Coniochaeta sp. PMI_546]|nr:hypothetical protein BR93DRAFT_928371 [Coniochaeta sp. PMI_546]
MSKLFRSARSLLPSPRVATVIPQAHTVHVQRVRLSRPARFRLRNFLLGGTVLYGCYVAYTTVVLSPVARWVEDEEEKLTAEERKALEEGADAAAFIPFPLTTHAVQPPPYSGRDPEWLEFVKLSKNKPLLQRIRDDLAFKVRKVAEASVPLTMKTGKPLKIRRYWLDIDYPYRPPIEYRRSGILLTDDGMEWTTQPVDSSLVNAVNRVLWPSPLFLSTWAFAGTMLKQNAQDLLRAVGYESKSPPAFPTSPAPQGTSAGAPGNPPPLPSQHHPDIQRALQRLQQQATKRPEDIKDPRAMASQNQGDAAYGSSPSPPPTGTSHPPGTSPDRSKSDQEKAGDLFPGQAAAQSISAEPWKAFKQQFLKAWKRVPEQPPRGCILVSGLVELEAPKGYTVVDVVAYWDPKTRQFDNKSMMVRLRRFQMKNQAPIRR